MNLINDVKSLLQSDGETAYVFVDEKGKEHSVDAASKKGLKGIIKKKSADENKNQLGQLIFDKQKVGVSDLKKLRALVDEIIVFYAENGSPVSKAKIKKEFPELF